MGKLYELLKSGEVPAPSFGLDFERMGTNKIADAMVRGKHSRNSDKWTVNRHGILVKAGEDRIALDYKDGKVGYLAEPGGTNLFPYSEDLTQWTQGRVTINSDTVVSPDPQKMADKLEETEEDDTHRIWRDITVPADSKITISFFAKADEREFIRITPSNFSQSTINLITGETSGEEVVVKNLSHGWVKIERVIDNTSGSEIVNNRFHFDIMLSMSTNSYMGVDGYGLYLWGFQFQESPVATSYIPTEGSTASRGADNLIFENAEELIGQQSGVMLVEVDFKFIDGVAQTIAELSDGSGNNRLYLQNPTTGFQDLAIITTSSGSSIVERTGTPFLSGIQKILVGYNDGEFLKTFINSQKLIQEGYVKPETLNNISIGSRRSDGQSVNSHIRKAYLWNNADWLTDELAEELTT